MKMSKSKLLYVTLASSLAILSTACGAKKTVSSNQPIKFSQAVPHKTIKKGGTLTYALENESPFTGIFSAEIADTSPDSEAAAQETKHFLILMIIINSPIKELPV